MDEQQTTSTCIVVSMLGGEAVLNRKQVEHIVEVSGKLEAQRNQLRAERDALKARVDTRDALINVMAPMHQLTCRNHKTCPICKAYDKYSKEIDGGSVDTTPGGDE